LHSPPLSLSPSPRSSLPIPTQHSTGNLPPGIGDLTGLEGLEVGGNTLTFPSAGTTGPWLSKLVALTRLDLSGNFQAGGISNMPDVSANTQLTYLNVQGCGFSGVLPAGFFVVGAVAFPGMAYLDLSGNDFSPAVPNFGLLTQLTYLDVSGNVKFTGAFPDITNLVLLADLKAANCGFRYRGGGGGERREK
jgi:Leucine-rich repeat (LRR) protein